MVIGPNFGNEITAAGLDGLPFTWGADGVNLSDPRLTVEQIAAIEVVIAAHDPTKPNPYVLYADALAAGCRVESIGTPSLNATYDASGAVWHGMRDEVLYITSFGSFSGGVTELVWMSMSGEITFATTNEFKAVTKGIGDWLTNWQQYLVGKAGVPVDHVIIP